jgi:hypothetical protein
MREESGNWEEFESRLLEKYGHDDALRLSKRDFMEWVETLGKGRSASAFLREFEDRFARLSALDRTVLDTSRVLLFVKSTAARDREKIGLLLETDDRLMADWAMVKTVCGRFDKRRDWADADSVGPGTFSAKKIEESLPASREETRRRPDDGSSSTSVAKGPSGGSALDEMTQILVRELQIAQARRGGGEPERDRKLPAESRCLWCDVVGHARKDCKDFAEAIRANVVYLNSGRVHDNKTRRMLELNVGRGGMKRLMEEAAARHAETVHYSASAGIRVGGEETRKMIDSRFWPTVLGGVTGVRLKKEKADRAEKQVKEVTGWSDPVEEKTGFVEAAGRPGERQNEADASGAQDKPKRSGYRLNTEIEKATDVRRVLEERILDSRVELSLWEVLGIAEKEVHDAIVDLVKRKRLSTEPEPERPLEVRMMYLEDVAATYELAESHYIARPHWARATTETPVRIGDVPEPVVALLDHGSEINLMSMDFYKKGKWPINTKHGWKIRAATCATEELHGACPNVRVKIEDVEINQHVFVQESSSHPIILGEPYITAVWMETKVLDNGSAYVRVRSQDGRNSV